MQRLLIHGRDWNLIVSVEYAEEHFAQVLVVVYHLYIFKFLGHCSSFRVEIEVLILNVRSSNWAFFRVVSFGENPWLKLALSAARYFRRLQTAMK